MPTLKVIQVCDSHVGTAEMPSCEIKFKWDNVPERGRPNLIWCVCCCIDHLEGRSTVPCYRILGEDQQKRCWNCLSQFKSCATNIPSNITAYAGKCRFKNEAVKPHDEREMLATLKDALEAHFKLNALAKMLKDSDNQYGSLEDRPDEDEDTSSYDSDSGVARRIPYTPVWAYRKGDH